VGAGGGGGGGGGGGAGGGGVFCFWGGGGAGGWIIWIMTCELQANVKRNGGHVPFATDAKDARRHHLDVSKQANAARP